jgi:CRISPR/Cas system-associated exonuclease Cas4 (RecB family)
MPDSPLRRLAALGTPAENGRWVIAGLESAQYSSGTGRDDPGWFHPSSLSHECEAYLAFRFLGAPAVQVIEPKTQRIFDLGSGRDEYLKRDMAASGISAITCEEDRHIEIPQLRIRGDLDDVVVHPRTGKLYVVDYKTMRKERWDELVVVYPGHHVQVHPYMAAKQTDKAYLIYENKNTQELKIKKADWDQNIWNEIVAKIHRILVGIDNNYVNRNPAAGCSRCPFSANGVCLSNDIAGLKARSGLWPDTGSTQNSTNTLESSSSSPSESSARTAASTTPRTPRLI